MIKQYTTATSGTVTATDTGQDTVLIHNAGVTLSLTIAFPATPVDGQMFCMTSVGGITTLALTSALTIVASLTSMSAGGNGTWMYNSDSTKWVKIR